MAALAEYDQYDAVELARLVRKKDVKPQELLQEARTRADALNGRLNAIVYRCDDLAETAISRISGGEAFPGVPFLVKDLGPALAGTPNTRGSRLFKNYIPKEDGEIVRRFKKAGFAIFGKTNTPEFGTLPVTEPSLFGACRNPWDLSRTPGGSSGGAAAAVAARIVPCAHASDGGGSIRIPASCCGLFGLKTSRGLNPIEDWMGHPIEDFVSEHVITRSVRDSAAVLDAISNRPGGQFSEALGAPRRTLRVGVVRSAMLAKTVSSEVEAGLDHTVKLLQGLGHQVHDAEPAVDYPALAVAFLTNWCFGVKKSIDDAKLLLGRECRKSDVELVNWGLAAAGNVLGDADLAAARTTFARTTQAFDSFFKNYDILLSPVLAKPPLRIGETAPNAFERLLLNALTAYPKAWALKTLIKTMAAQSFAFAAFTMTFNVTGMPAASVPVYWTESNLPIGMQIATGVGGDALLLQLAHELEEAVAWTHRAPPLLNAPIK
jgi:amidase